MTLTKRQSEILDFIRSSFRESGCSPTFGEIQSHFGFGSPGTVSGHLDLLEKKGAIYREAGYQRTIHLADPVARRELLNIPLLGTIPAGHPGNQEQQADRCIAIDTDSLRLPMNARTFALEVHGDSMKDAAIVDGDIVIMEFCEPRHRDIVAALIDGETTLKRYLVQKGKPFLRAENPKYPDLIPAQELVIQGVFRALLRTDRRRL
jgi:repressor LexA